MIAEPIRLALVGLGEATQRLAGAIDQRDRVHLFTAIGEALAWLNSADEVLEKAKPGGAAYRKLRDDDEEGKVVRGLRWARNQNLHALVAVHEIGGGMGFPLTFPMNFSYRVFWQSPDELPPTERPQPHNEEAYRRIAGQMVLGTLRQASSFLWRAGQSR